MARKQNEYYIQGEVTVILVQRKDGTSLEVLIDTEELVKVQEFYWCAMKRPNTWYIYAGTWDKEKKKNGKHVLLHRLIMDAEPGTLVDHENRNGLDNRKQNLRKATDSENGANSVRKGDSSKYKGVELFRNGKWRARIKVHRKEIHLGYFHDEEEAARAYDRAAREHFGEFARTNF